MDVICAHTFFTHTHVCSCVHKYKYDTPNIMVFSFIKILYDSSWSVSERSLVKMFKLVFMLIVLACTVLLMQATEMTYSTKYDDIDTDAILTNSRLRNQYFDCVLEKGPCNNGAAHFLKDTLPEAIVTKCRRCTSKQVAILDKILSWYAQNKPEEFKNIVESLINNYRNKRH